MSNRATIDDPLVGLARSNFRAGFRLNPKDRAYGAAKGYDTLAPPCRRFHCARRLAQALPAKDGQQTPMRGHPVFVAQHATATCCRTCLAKWHAIPPGQPLTAAEQMFMIDLVMRWIMAQGLSL